MKGLDLRISVVDGMAFIDSSIDLFKYIDRMIVLYDADGKIIRGWCREWPRKSWLKRLWDRIIEFIFKKLW